jgi:WD40 repeat protein
VNYDAFISYSHATDGKLAPALQSGLQRMAKPWYRIRALRVFRDESALSTNPQLWTSIQAALDESEWFVLLASPDAVHSEWVNRELEYWLTNKSADRFLPAVTDGTWEWVGGRLVGTAVLPALSREVSEEPRHLDLRWAHSEADLDLHNTRFRDAVAQLAAPMHGVAKDDLESEDVSLQRRARRLARGAVITLALLTGVAVLFGVVAVRANNRAQASAREARHQATVADSQRLAAQAQPLAAGNFDLALLLAVEARRLDDSVASRGALEAVLSSGARLQRVVQLASDSTANVSTDGRLLAVGNSQGDVTVRNVSSGHVLTEFADGGRAVSFLAFSRDGHTLAVSRYGGVDLRSVTTGRTVGRPLIWRDTAALGLFFSPDGNQLAGTDERGDIVDWQLTSTVRAARVLSRPNPALTTAFTWSRDSRTFAVLDTNGTITAWDLATTPPPPQQIPTTNFACPQAMAFAPDGRTLVVGLADGRIGLFDLATRRQLGSPMGDPGPCISWFASSPDGSTLAAVTATGTVTQWDVVHRRQRAAPLAGIGATTTSGLLGADDMLTTLAPGTIDVWRLGTVGPALGRTIAHMTGGTAGIFLSHDGSLAFISGSRAPQWILYDMRRGRILAVHPKTDIIGHVSWNPDATMIAIGRTDGTIRLVDRTTGRTRGVFASHRGPVTVITFSPDGRLMGSGGTDGTVPVWNLATRRLDGAPFRASGSVYGTAFSPDGKNLALASTEGTLTIYDVGTHRAIHTYDSHEPLISLAYSPDGKTLAVSGFSGTRLFDAATGQPVGEPLAGHSGVVTAVSFSGDGSTLASSSIDGTVTLYDVASRQPIGDPLNAGYAGGAGTTTLSPDGRVLVTAYGDGHVVIWDVDPAAWQQRACALAGRNLTRDEWRQYLGSRPYEMTCAQWPAGQ